MAYFFTTFIVKNLSIDPNPFIIMKKITLLSLLGFNALCLYAQESGIAENNQMPASKERNKELGVFSQFFHEGQESGDKMLIGVQFRQQVQPHINFRALAAYHRYQYEARPDILDNGNSDSLRARFSGNNADILAIGLGLEAQRQFYKRVWLFAGLELQAGYGTGKTQSSSRTVPYGRTFTGPPDMFAPDYKSESYQRTYVRLVPGIGAKIVFNRINFGLETQFASIGIFSEKTGESRVTNPGIDILNNLAYRFQVNYRF